MVTCHILGITNHQSFYMIINYRKFANLRVGLCVIEVIKLIDHDGLHNLWSEQWIASKDKNVGSVRQHDNLRNNKNMMAWKVYLRTFMVRTKQLIRLKQWIFVRLSCRASKEDNEESELHQLNHITEKWRNFQNVRERPNPIAGIVPRALVSNFTRNCYLWLGFDFMLQESDQHSTTVIPCLNCCWIVNSTWSSNYQTILLCWKHPMDRCCCCNFPLMIKVADTRSP